jgi:hypothetical protein
MASWRQWRWGPALGELLIVFVGILAAVQVDRLNESRKERAVLQDYLDRIIIDLDADAAFLEVLTGRVQRGRVAVDNLLAWIDGEQPRPADSVLVNTINSAWSWDFPTGPRAGTYQDMLSTGSLSLIADSELRSALISYHENPPGAALRSYMDYREVWEINPTGSRLFPHLDARALSDPTRTLFVTDWERLSGDEELASMLRVLSRGHADAPELLTWMATTGEDLRALVISAGGRPPDQGPSP